jgi:DNA polymerase III subunit gamma/tau
MGKALYRKHRPKKLSEIIGQDHITDTLSHALKQGMVSHAYLLTGPRGVGKTSVARILAYEANGLPYDEEGTHLDIIEIDAASNRRIDEIRELKERVNIAPTSAKYKVYIIDEVHMLTKEAFNALLKTLEEPPEHVIFVLATTEAHKVPETIISRTQRFTFKPVEPDKVVAHLKDIAESEKIGIDDGALELIAAHGEGSFRDSISLLDQVRHINKHVTLPDVQQAIGQAPDELLNELLSGVSKHDIQAIGAGLASLRSHGVQAAQIARQLSSLLRHGLLAQEPQVDTSQSLQLLAELLHVPAANDPAIALELALYKSALTDVLQRPEPRVPDKETAQAAIKIALHAEKPAVPSKSLAPDPQRQPKNPSGSLDAESWHDVLTAVKAKHNTLYGIARMAAPRFEIGKLTLVFAFAFHQKRLNDTKNRQLLQDIIAQVTGEDVVIECVLDNSTEPVTVIAKPELKNTDEINLETISNIFGSAEIVE